MIYVLLTRTKNPIFESKPTKLARNTDFLKIQNRFGSFHKFILWFFYFRFNQSKAMKIDYFSILFWLNRTPPSLLIVESWYLYQSIANVSLRGVAALKSQNSTRKPSGRRKPPKNSTNALIAARFSVFTRFEVFQEIVTEAHRKNSFFDYA